MLTRGTVVSSRSFPRSRAPANFVSISTNHSSFQNHALMEKLPLSFCLRVVAQLRPQPTEPNPLEGAGPMWFCAFSAFQRNRETISQVIIRSLPDSSDWEYCFIGWKYHRLEDLLKRSRNMVRILEVRFHHEKEPRRPYFRVSAEDLKTKLLPYVAGQVADHASFHCSLNSTPEIQEHLGTFFSFFKDRRCFTTFDLNYQGPATEDFLRYQLNEPADYVSVILTGYDWPMTAKAVMVDLIGRFRHLYLSTDRSNIDLDPMAFSMILHYWISGHYPRWCKLSFARNMGGLTQYSDIRRDLRNQEGGEDGRAIVWEVKRSDGTSSSLPLTMYSDSAYIRML
uniref:FBA_2 domain-containing protein n=1 Tax=Steinernema glaseri TaxID=37863 RepID=A0A1I8A0I8_9BILA